MSTVPGGQFDSVNGVQIRGRAYLVDSGIVSPGYFSVLSIPIVAGGSFSERDTTESPNVVVVNEALARAHWETPARAIGRTIAMGTRSTTTQTGRVISDLEWTIVGVVADARDLAEGAAPRPKVYWSYRQASRGSTQMTLLVRTSGVNAGALTLPLTRLVRDINPGQPLYNVLPLDTILRSRFARERALAAVMSGFATLTLLVAVLGVHAAMAYAGTLRRHELGVRLALGGSRMAVLRSLAWRGAKQVLVGIELGIFLAVMLVTVLQSWLFGTGNADLGTMAGAVALVAAISAIALLAPAWRATRIDPIEMLRAQ